MSQNNCHQVFKECFRLSFRRRNCHCVSRRRSEAPSCRNVAEFSPVGTEFFSGYSGQDSKRPGNSGTPIIYLGFLDAAMASVRVMVSGMKNVLGILDRSQWHLRESPSSPTRAASGSSLNREETGPASWSPSKRSASSGQALIRTIEKVH